MDELLRVKPVSLSPIVVEALAGACAQVGLPDHRLASGAGHDAQIMAGVANAGMIFVRCRDGISHSPAEYVTPDDAFLGAQVMHEATLRLGGGVGRT